jgi:hypothetical protein
MACGVHGPDPEPEPEPEPITGADSVAVESSRHSSPQSSRRPSIAQLRSLSARSEEASVALTAAFSALSSGRNPVRFPAPHRFIRRLPTERFRGGPPAALRWILFCSLACRAAPSPSIRTGALPLPTTALITPPRDVLPLAPAPLVPPASPLTRAPAYAP